MFFGLIKDNLAIGQFSNFRLDFFLVLDYTNESVNSTQFLIKRRELMKYFIFEDVVGESHKIIRNLQEQGHEVMIAGHKGCEEAMKSANVILVSVTLFCMQCHIEEHAKDLRKWMDEWEIEGRKVYLLRFSGSCDINKDKWNLSKYEYFRHNF